MPEAQRIKTKVCLVGEAAVGKTSLIRRFVQDEFDDRYITTLGAKVSKREMTFESRDRTKIHMDMTVWDIMGEKGFRDLLKEAFFHGAKGVVAVCDLTRYSTLKELDDWVQSVFNVVVFQAQDPNASFLVNYLAPGGLYSYPGIGELWLQMALTMTLVLIPFVIPIYRMGLLWSELTVFGLCSLVLAAIPFVSPTFAPPLWHRWLLIGAIALLPSLPPFLAVLSAPGKAGVLALLAILVVPFLVLPAGASAPLLATSWTTRYIPGSMVENSIPIDDCPALVAALTWVQDGPYNHSVFAAQARFAGWTYVFLPGVDLRPFWSAAEFDSIRSSSATPVITVWWAGPTGWAPEFSPPPGLHIVHQEGHIAIYYE